MSGGLSSRQLKRNIERQHGKGAANSIVAIQIANQTKRELDALVKLLIERKVIPPQDVRTPGGVAIAQPGQFGEMIK